MLVVVVQPVCKGSFLANTTTLYVQTVSTYATWHRHAINVSRLLDSLTGLEAGLASFFFWQLFGLFTLQLSPQMDAQNRNTLNIHSAQHEQEQQKREKERKNTYQLQSNHCGTILKCLDDEFWGVRHVPGSLTDDDGLRR